MAAERILAGLLAGSEHLREGIVLTIAGRRRAGSPALVGPALDLLRATDAAGIEVTTDRGAVLAARDAHHAVVVAADRAALPALVLLDLRRALADLRDATP